MVSTPNERCSFVNKLTVVPGFCGAMSIFASLRYCLGDPDDYTNIWAALAFMPFGLFFDFFDGKASGIDPTLFFQN